MASRNSVKQYSNNAFYHIYNRGVEKRTIFQDDQDYSVFLSYLQTYLLPKDEEDLRQILSSASSSATEKDKAIKLLRLNNFSSDIELHCYALLPNHFHLLVRQKRNVLHSFMNSLGTRYSMYFNRKNHRTGVLFQDVYKAVLVETDNQLLHLSRYIHLNPIKWIHLPLHRWKEASFPSSLPDYIANRQTEWLEKDHILRSFSRKNKELTYKSFLSLNQDETFIHEFTIDSDVID